uniref:F-box domain-containing protein n=1 Tax=Aureoumbra lagunensis TaxID=44058 RepID=A0A7S3K036_9STRA
MEELVNYFKREAADKKKVGIIKNALDKGVKSNTIVLIKSTSGAARYHLNILSSCGAIKEKKTRTSKTSKGKNPNKNISLPLSSLPLQVYPIIIEFLPLDISSEDLLALREVSRAFRNEIDRDFSSAEWQRAIGIKKFKITHGFHPENAHRKNRLTISSVRERLCVICRKNYKGKFDDVFGLFAHNDCRRQGSINVYYTANEYGQSWDSLCSLALQHNIQRPMTEMKSGWRRFSKQSYNYSVAWRYPAWFIPRHHSLFGFVESLAQFDTSLNSRLSEERGRRRRLIASIYQQHDLRIERERRAEERTHNVLEQLGEADGARLRACIEAEVDPIHCQYSRLINPNTLEIDTSVETWRALIEQSEENIRKAHQRPQMLRSALGLETCVKLDALLNKKNHHNVESRFQRTLRSFSSEFEKLGHPKFSNNEIKITPEYWEAEIKRLSHGLYWITTLSKNLLQNSDLFSRFISLHNRLTPESKSSTEISSLSTTFFSSSYYSSASPLIKRLLILGKSGSNIEVELQMIELAFEHAAIRSSSSTMDLAKVIIKSDHSLKNEVKRQELEAAKKRAQQRLAGLYAALGSVDEERLRACLKAEPVSSAFSSFEAIILDPQAEPQICADEWRNKIIQSENAIQCGRDRLIRIKKLLDRDSAQVDELRRTNKSVQEIFDLIEQPGSLSCNLPCDEIKLLFHCRRIVDAALKSYRDSEHSTILKSNISIRDSLIRLGFWENYQQIFQVLGKSSILNYIHSQKFLCFCLESPLIKRLLLIERLLQDQGEDSASEELINEFQKLNSVRSFVGNAILSENNNSLVKLIICGHKPQTTAYHCDHSPNPTCTYNCCNHCCPFTKGLDVPECAGHELRRLTASFIYDDYYDDYYDGYDSNYDY